MTERMEPFRFHECMALTRATGRRAGDLIELVEILRQVEPASIFHHMHQYFLKPHVRPPEFPNDFAVWASDELEDKVLAERLANLNPFEFAGIEGIRGELVRIIDEHMKEYPLPRPVVEGKEFFFNEGVTLVFPTGFEASDLPGFLDALRRVDPSSIYFHFYEARLRLGRETDDFSRFCADCLEGECPGLSERLKSLDPYMYTTEVLRSKLIAMLEPEAG